MSLEIGLTEGPTNTQYAPLAALFALYQAQNRLEPLAQVQISMKTRDFSPADKLQQVLLSILAGCETLSEVNVRLKPEVGLARVWGWPRIADQSTLSRLLDVLTLKQIEQLRQVTLSIWKAHSLTERHDWRGYLWLDFDLSGLPCSPRAEESQKGYFRDKKTPPGGNWLGSVWSDTGRRSGRTSSQGTGIRPIACAPPSKQPKLL